MSLIFVECRFYRVLSLQISITQCCRGISFSFIFVCRCTARNRQRFLKDGKYDETFMEYTQLLFSAYLL